MGFKIDSIGPGFYAGFQLDGDGRFLLGDFVVTHNSVIATLQRIGRGMRTDGGRKASFEVYDILDMGSPMMERHSRRRMNTYVREGYQTIVQASDGTMTGYAPKLRTRREKRERATFRSTTLR